RHKGSMPLSGMKNTKGVFSFIYRYLIVIQINLFKIVAANIHEFSILNYEDIKNEDAIHNLITSYLHNFIIPTIQQLNN
ncbi:MAG: hypothetical protein J5719_05170, partial [Bacteroidales bacterium]|nr:hypothetical protein [Bacteroidales bacterium]